MFIQRLAGALIIGGLFTASASAQSYVRQVEPTPDQLGDHVRAKFIRAGDVSPEEYARLLEEAEKVRAYQGNTYSYDYSAPAETTYSTETTTYSTGATTVYDGRPAYSGTTTEGYQIELYETPIPATSTVTTYSAPVATSTYSAPLTTSIYTASTPIVTSASHTVVKGDTLYSLSKRYGVSVSDLRSTNGISGNNIGIGQVLAMPGQRRSISQPVTSGTSATLIRNVEPIPFSGIYAVLPGDTLYSIAERACVDVSEIKSNNGLGSDTILPGQRLTMPSGHCLR